MFSEIEVAVYRYNTMECLVLTWYVMHWISQPVASSNPPTVNLPLKLKFEYYWSLRPNDIVVLE